MTNISEGLKYTKSHEWFDPTTGRIGISAFAVEHLGDVVEVDLPEVGTEISQGDELGTVESVKTASEVYSPVSGKVIAVNEALADSPELVNESPYNEGWLIAVEIENNEELDSLMNSASYQEHCSEEE
ncbi:glycine cleavage system protein GcvH [Myxococcota bacterium]|nr:glycine cleavage system protein GcvH [Myxococcota bacterium]MBU1382992.1 glycine cleavage system protein GcvH [Myxococcota bacterium]MBU1499172.1 glycine cleavage system protein GcvH [Myxococcota bacterium]